MGEICMPAKKKTVKKKAPAKVGEYLVLGYGCNYGKAIQWANIGKYCVDNSQGPFTLDKAKEKVQRLMEQDAANGESNQYFIVKGIAQPSEVVVSMNWKDLP
jgi:hypothetical protein